MPARILIAAVIFFLCPGLAMADGHPGVSVTGRPGPSFSTAGPEGDSTAEEARQRYRACLFAYLPRIGSDAAAEYLRQACAEEYLGRDAGGAGEVPADRWRPSPPP